MWWLFDPAMRIHLPACCACKDYHHLSKQSGLRTCLKGGRRAEQMACCCIVRNEDAIESERGGVPKGRQGPRITLIAAVYGRRSEIKFGGIWPDLTWGDKRIEQASTAPGCDENLSAVCHAHVCKSEHACPLCRRRFRLRGSWCAGGELALPMSSMQQPAAPRLAGSATTYDLLLGQRCNIVMLCPLDSGAQWLPVPHPRRSLLSAHSPAS